MRPAFSILAALGLLLATVGTTAALAQAPGPAPGPPGQPPGPGVVTAPPPPAGPAAAPGGAPPVVTQRAVARLVDPRNPLMRGDVLLEQTTAGRTAITVTVYGLERGSTHANHIYRGSCEGPILFPLQDLVADRSGVARSVSTVRAPIDLETWWVQAHASYVLPSPGIICGRVERVPAPVAAITLPGSAPPIIPEADTLPLLGAGLVLLGAMAAWRARRPT